MVREPLTILCGGRATRLRSLGDQLPKFLLPVTDRKVFADFQLSWAAKQGFRDVVLCTGWLGEKIEQYCGDGSKWDLRLRYSHDGAVPQGTGGAVKKAWPSPSGPVAVLYGDTILDLNAEDILNHFHTRPAGAALMTVFSNSVTGHASNADFDGNLVHYSKKNPRPNWTFIDYGFSVLSPECLASLPSGTASDLAEGFERWSAAERLFGWLCENRFWELNTPEALVAFRERFGSHET